MVEEWEGSSALHTHEKWKGAEKWPSRRSPPPTTMAMDTGGHTCGWGMSLTLKVLPHVALERPGSRWWGFSPPVYQYDYSEIIP
jgi:hypothetical protein